MKHLIAQFLDTALERTPELRSLLGELPLESTVERTRDAEHGDFASNLAMRLARPARRKPRELAETIVAHMPEAALLDRVEIAGPGFINFRLVDRAFHDELLAVLEQAENYGRRPVRETPRILLEFVSANPTGPLHVGHGRHAAFGATVGNLLEAAGFPVDREYYVNDAGRQMDILGVSVWLRWLESEGVEFDFPNAGYRGDYIRDIAADITIDASATVDADTLLRNVPPDEPVGDEPVDDKPVDDKPVGDKEAHIEALIGKARALLGEEGFDAVRRQAMESIRDDIEDDLAGFGVHYDRWYSERSLIENERIDQALAVLDERGMLYRKDGATWFKASDFGDEKDRVVVRENGAKTYFASDIAYHYDKRVRGFDRLIDIFGADHHGYVARVKAGLTAMGYAAEDLEVELVQFVALYRGGKKLAMSTRAGEFVTLRQLREEVGNDAARFFYVMRSNDQHLDFDLELAKSRSNDNPVYYIQYAHARIASVFRQLADKSLTWDAENGPAGLDRLCEPEERSLMTSLSRYPEVLELSAAKLAPQHLVHYLRDLANDFHSYYNAHAFIVEDAPLRDARLTLCAATRVVIANGLGILGVSAPEAM